MAISYSLSSAFSDVSFTYCWIQQSFLILSIRSVSLYILQLLSLLLFNFWTSVQQNYPCNAIMQMCRMLSMYDVGEEDSDAFIDESQNSLVRQSYPLHMQLPVVEIMKVLASFSCSQIILMYFCLLC